MGKHLWGYPRIRNFGSIVLETMTRIRVFFGVLEISKLWPAFQTSGASSWLVAGRPSLPGSPRCREALVAGRPSLPGGPRCRVAGRPSLPGGPRCREVNLSLKGSSCKAFHYCQGPDPRLLRGGPSQGKLLLGSSRYEGPRCQGGPRALVAGKPSLPGAPPCREALVAGKPSPGVPCCREASLGKHLRGVPQDSQFWVDF